MLWILGLLGIGIATGLRTARSVSPVLATAAGLLAAACAADVHGPMLVVWTGLALIAFLPARPALLVGSIAGIALLSTPFGRQMIGVVPPFDAAPLASRVALPVFVVAAIVAARLHAASRLEAAGIVACTLLAFVDGRFVPLIGIVCAPGIVARLV